MSEAIHPRSSHGPDADALYVAARAPRPGFTKTRLGRAIGHERATALYVAFVRDLAARLEALPCTVGWYVTPDDAWSDLSPLVPAERSPSGRPRPILAQPLGDWTERQRALFASAWERGERRTVLIASDSPHLDNDLIAEAFVRLWHDDLVLGPTDDGGYYLIGVRTPANGTTPRPWDALAGVRMSTGTVLDEILAHAASLGLRTGLLAPTFDVDEAADLDRLIPLALARDDLAATRATMERLGLMRSPTEAVERRADAPVALGSVR